MNPPSRRPPDRNAAARSRKAKPASRRTASRSEPVAPGGRWLPALAAAGVLLVVVFAGGVGGVGGVGGGNSRGDASGPDGSPADAGFVDSTSTTDIYGVTGLTVADSTVLPTSTTVVGAARTTLDRPLLSGVFGNDVKALQTRLTELGFAPGVADGAFGEQTKQAVWAYEKLVLKVPRADAAGKVTDEMWQGMQGQPAIQPRRPAAGTHVEIYLPEQVAAVFSENTATLVVHISSGDDKTWCETVTLDTDANGNRLDPPQQKPVCGVSYTPGGVFRFQRAISGDRVGALGRMFNPIYFNYGIAMHGAKNVPLEPVSHGCIRMHQTISNTFQSFVHLKDLVYVWGQDGREPEAYSKKESTPIFNYPDPDATTTTTTPATTTTIRATTTTAAAATTTTAKTTVTSSPVTSSPVTSSPVTSSPVTSNTVASAGPVPSTTAPTTTVAATGPPPSTITGQ